MLGVGGSGSGKHGKVKKLKAGDIRRLKEKLIENDKLADKDDASSTTTETSSIEADDKVQWMCFVYNNTTVTIMNSLLFYCKVVSTEALAL